MKQQYNYGIVSTIVLSILINIFNRADATLQLVQEESTATTVRQWQSQLSQLNNSVAIITDIKVRQTPQGIEIAIYTANGKKIRGISSTRGNDLIVNIPNARLKSNEPLGISNPVDGISMLTARTSKANNAVNLIISGNEGTPTGEITKSDRGLIISATPPTPVADTSTPDSVIDIDEQMGITSQFVCGTVFASSFFWANFTHILTSTGSKFKTDWFDQLA